jgi:hypothetical protein
MAILKYLPRPVALASLLIVSPAIGQDWETIPFIKHSEYQAVNSDGSSAYGGTFPIRLIGVVANNTEDWLDPTPDYDPGYSPWQMGGEAEFFLQAVNLDETPWDPDPANPFDDFGGTACWMGQNYGNHIIHQDPFFSYTDAEWTAELGRLGLFGGDGVTNPLAVGDLVEVRVRGGLSYQGKMNVNEQHNSDPANDFEVVVLQRGFGVPDPEPVQLADLKDAADQFIFDPTRQTGGEHWQGGLVRLLNLQVETAVEWTSNTDIEVTDGVRTLSVHLGLNPGFDGTVLFQPGEIFDLIGVLDQKDPTYQGGYRLLAMHIAHADPVPTRLSLDFISGETVVRWPENEGTHLLYSNSLEPGSWQPVAETPSAGGGMRTHREPLNSDRKFFMPFTPAP